MGQSKIENGSIVPNIGIPRRLVSYYCCDLKELLPTDEDDFVGVFGILKKRLFI